MSQALPRLNITVSPSVTISSLSRSQPSSRAELQAPDTCAGPRPWHWQAALPSRAQGEAPLKPETSSPGRLLGNRRCLETSAARQARAVGRGLWGPQGSLETSWGYRIQEGRGTLGRGVPGLDPHTHLTGMGLTEPVVNGPPQALVWSNSSKMPTPAGAAPNHVLFWSCAMRAASPIRYMSRHLSSEQRLRKEAAPLDRETRGPLLCGSQGHLSPWLCSLYEHSGQQQAELACTWKCPRLLCNPAVGWVTIAHRPGHQEASGTRVGDAHGVCQALSVHGAATGSPQMEGFLGQQGGGTHRAASRRCSSGSLCRAVAPVGGRSPETSPGGATC